MRGQNAAQINSPLRPNGVSTVKDVFNQRGEYLLKVRVDESFHVGDQVLIQTDSGKLMDKISRIMDYGGLRSTNSCEKGQEVGILLENKNNEDLSKVQSIRGI